MWWPVYSELGTCSWAARSPASSVSRRRSRSTNAAIARTSTTPPSTPISTTARAKSGPLFNSVAASTDSTTISLMPARMPDDEERLRDDLARAQARPHGVKQFDEDEDQQQSVENLDHHGGAGVFRSRSIVLNCAMSSATEPTTSTTAMPQ